MAYSPQYVPKMQLYSTGSESCATPLKGKRPLLAVCGFVFIAQSCPGTEEPGGADSSPLAMKERVHRKQREKPPAWKSVTLTVL